VSVLNFMPHALGQEDPKTLNGMISTRQPAPQSLIDPLFVVLPDWNPDVYFEINDWPACHGTELPPAGNECLLQYDHQDNLRCTWWQGTTDFSNLELGAFGGDLTGTASSANVSTVLGGQVPMVLQPLVWHALPYVVNRFGNGWLDYGQLGGDDNWQAGQYALDQFGNVQIRGLLAKNVAWVDSDTIATLPAGFRPAMSEMFDTFFYDNTNGSLVGRVNVYLDGTLQLDGATVPAVSSGGVVNYLTLKHITFVQGN
jgi:hypothetical protein